MKHTSEKIFFAYTIDYEGTILQEIAVQSGKQIASKPFNSMFDLIVKDEHKKFYEFLNVLKITLTPISESFYVDSPQGRLLIDIIGTGISSGILIIGGDSVTFSCFRSLEEMMLINSEQANHIRNLSKELAALINDPHQKHLELYRQFSDTNNELANAQRLLAKKNAELERAMKEITLLSRLIPICASCKKIRDDDGFWQNVESYLSERSKIVFSHSVCPDCIEKLYPEFAKKDKKE